jgi:5'-methylthioadenosine phosphorylase
MIGIIGGSGLYDIEGLESLEWRKLETPFGNPSDDFLIGKLAGRDVVFLPRHARGHKILPSEINHRANILAMKSLGIRFIISVGAVGSLQEKYKPLDIVVPDQFIDRTKHHLDHTFFGSGIVAHVTFADPISKELQKLLYDEAKKAVSAKSQVHLNGTYVNMEGPAFSTRAESEMYRKVGGDVIGMTNLAEAKLACEAEIAYAALSMITDYDCWKRDEEPVSVEMIIQRLNQNAENAKAIIKAVIPKIPLDANWPCHSALRHAIITDKKHWPASTVEKLRPILSPYL